MSKESAMAAYVHEMKKVAQEVLLKLLWPTLEEPTVERLPVVVSPTRLAQWFVVSIPPVNKVFH